LPEVWNGEDFKQLMHLQHFFSAVTQNGGSMLLTSRADAG